LIVAMLSVDRPAAQNSRLESPDNDPDIPTVSDISELRARTPGEQTRAEFFGGVATLTLFRPGSVLELLREGGSRFAMPEIGPVPPDGAPPPNPDDDWRSPVCAASAVFVGRVVAQHVLLSENARTLFTDYTIEAERWLRPKAGPSGISATGRGGVVRFGGHIVRVDRYDPIHSGRALIFLGAKFTGLQPEDGLLLSGVIPVDDGVLASIARVSESCASP